MSLAVAVRQLTHTDPVQGLINSAKGLIIWNHSRWWSLTCCTYTDNKDQKYRWNPVHHQTLPPKYFYIRLNCFAKGVFGGKIIAPCFMFPRSVLYFFTIIVTLRFLSLLPVNLRTEGVTQCTDCKDKLPLLPWVIFPNPLIFQSRCSFRAVNQEGLHWLSGALWYR